MLLVPIIIIILALGLYMYINEPSYTGLSQYQELKNFHRDLNLRFESSSTINFDLDRVPYSLKLQGSFEEGTSARVYFVDEGQRYLVLDTGSLESPFDGACAETCELETLQEDVVLSIEVDSGVLVLDRLKYSAFESEGNMPPEWHGRTAFFIDGIAEYEIDLDNYFVDPDRDNITYFIRSRNPFEADLADGHVLRIVTDKGSGGEHSIRIFASDLKHTIDKTIDVSVLGLDEQDTGTAGLDPEALPYTQPCADFTENNKSIILTGNAQRFEGNGPCYRIQADNFVLDCANSVIHADDGIVVSGNNVEIKNCQIYSRKNGIIAQNANNLNIHDNKLYRHEGTGIMLNNVHSSRIHSNHAEGNLFGIRCLSSKGHNLVTGNVLRNNRASGILLADTSRTVVAGNELTDNMMYGVTLFLSDNVLLEENNITGSANGIALVANSRNNEIVGNNVNCSNSIFFENSRFNTVRSNSLREGSVSYDVLAEPNAELDRG